MTIPADDSTGHDRSSKVRTIVNAFRPTPRWVVTVAMLVAVAAASSLTTYLLTGQPSTPAASEDTVQNAADEEPEVDTESSPEKTMFTVHGTMSVAQFVSRDEPCTTSGGYSDIRKGTAVIIRSDDGATLATGELLSGEGHGLEGCVFAFRVHEVPLGHDYYKIEVGHRGELTYSEEQMQENLELTLG